MLEDGKLRVFVTLAREGNFTRAARCLGISQPAVSQSIAETEKAVGARLFDRARGIVSLTDKGRLFLAYAEEILHWYDDAGVLFSPTPSESRRKVRLAIDGQLVHLLPERLRDNFFAPPEGIEFVILPYGDASADISIRQDGGKVTAEASAEFVRSAVFHRILESIID